jgi:NADPH:quinone reductase-like Zn-dependent oxidoreductase
LSTQKNTRVLITAKGGPEVLKLVEEDLSQPSSGEVRIKVLAAGVAFADILMRHGLYPNQPPFPFSPGYDVVGDIDAVGDGVENFRAGQRVAALTMTGGYSQFTIAPAAHLVPVPDGVDPAEAVALVLNYATAYQMIQRVARLRPGQSLLVHSAAGGVGTAALQLGKNMGLTMFGTASKPKHSVISALGVVPIDYRRENCVARIQQLVPDGLDCVLDPIGGPQWWRSYRCLKRGGTLVCYGVQAAVAKGKFTAGAGFALLGLMKLLPDGKKATWYNIKTLRDRHPEQFRDDLSTLFELLVTRQIQPLIAAKFPLKEAARANAMLESAQLSGKLVLFPQE